MTNKKRWYDNQAVFVLLTIVVGFLIGALVLKLAEPKIGVGPVTVYKELFSGMFGSKKYLAFDIIYATPLIFTGLSVAFAFRTGLFNIGAEGQYIMGSLAAVLVGVFVQAPIVLHGILCLLAGAGAGALWAGIAGICKAKRGLSEVITGIMLNWIALYFSNFMIKNTALSGGGDSSAMIAKTASIKIPALQVSKGTMLNAGIFIAIGVAILMYIILNKTTLGYRLRAVGFNQNASLYGGINVTRSMIVSMLIAGALAGLAGAIQVTGVQSRINVLNAQEGYGFDGLSVAMVGANNPFAVFFSGLFFGAMKYAGGKLTNVNAPTEIVSIIMGCVLYFTAIANGLRMMLSRWVIRFGKEK